MKRKLPQWLLDATNNNDKSPKTDSPQQRSRTNSNDIQTDSAQHFDTKIVGSDEIQSNGTITVVPLANLLSPSRVDIQINYTSSSIHTSDNNTDVGMRTNESTSVAIGIVPLSALIKTERIDPTEPTTSNLSNEQPQVTVKQEIKDEPADAVTTTPPTLVPKIESVKPERRSCNYGIKCFRRNADHRTEMAHPGDVDYRRPNLPNAPIGTPPCPWGAACYRRNPQHFLQLSHPPSTASTTTVVPNVLPQSNNAPMRQNRNIRVVIDNGSDEDDYDLLDPFLDDGSSDEYVPDEDENDEDDTQELTDN